MKNYLSRSSALSHQRFETQQLMTAHWHHLLSVRCCLLHLSKRQTMVQYAVSMLTAQCSAEKTIAGVLCVFDSHAKPSESVSMQHDPCHVPSDLLLFEFDDVNLQTTLESDEHTQRLGASLVHPAAAPESCIPHPEAADALAVASAHVPTRHASYHLACRIAKQRHRAPSGLIA